MATAGPLKEVRPKLRQSTSRRTLRNVKEHPVSSFSVGTILLAICSLLGGFVDGWSLADRLFGQGPKPTPAAPEFVPVIPPAREDSGRMPVIPPAPASLLPTPAPPTGRFLMDLTMTASDGAQPAACTTGGQTFRSPCCFQCPRATRCVGATRELTTRSRRASGSWPPPSDSSMNRGPTGRTLK